MILIWNFGCQEFNGDPLVLYSMQPGINKTSLVDNRKGFWKVVYLTYLKKDMVDQLYDLKVRIVSTKQTKSITKYYNILKGLYLELDVYENVEMECMNDTKKAKDMIEWERSSLHP